MSLMDLVPEDKRVDYDSIRCPNCQSHEDCQLVNTRMLMVMCKNDNCRVKQFEVKDSVRP